MVRDAAGFGRARRSRGHQGPRCANRTWERDGRAPGGNHKNPERPAPGSRRALAGDWDPEAGVSLHNPQSPFSPVNRKGALNACQHSQRHALGNQPRIALDTLNESKHALPIRKRLSASSVFNVVNATGVGGVDEGLEVEGHVRSPALTLLALQACSTHPQQSILRIPPHSVLQLQNKTAKASFPAKVRTAALSSCTGSFRKVRIRSVFVRRTR